MTKTKAAFMWFMSVYFVALAILLIVLGVMLILTAPLAFKALAVLPLSGAGAITMLVIALWNDAVSRSHRS